MRLLLCSYICVLLLLLPGCSSLLPVAGSASEPMEAVQPPAPVEVDISALEAAADKMSLFQGDDQLRPLSDDGVARAEVDSETLADNLLLLGFDQSPPDVEGRSVVAGDEFDFPVVDNAKVRYFVDYYTGPGRKVFGRWLSRSGRYLPQMRQIFADEGLPRDLAYLAMVESGFNLKAYSWAHAVGPWQFIESTARMYGLKMNWWVDERRDFIKSTHAAAHFLKDLNRRFKGNWYLSVAAYNAGGGKISRAVKKYGSDDFWVISRGKYLQQETRNYVPKLLAVLQIARHRQDYGFTDLKMQEPFRYDEVALPSTTDLEVVAHLSDSDYARVKELNPELRRWSTPPETSGYQVRIPAGRRQTFVARYSKLPSEKRISYLRHRIVAGDTLGSLAHKHRIRIEDIVRLNRIRNPRALKVGSDLILPLSRDYNRRPLAELGDDYVKTRRRTYRVRSGDSLWSIGRRFGVSEKQLRVWNRLGWSNILRPGQRLAVSAKGVRAKGKRSSSPGATRKIVYRVKKGDTLWGIGRRFAVAMGDIRDWNNLAGNHVLRPGETLTLMVHRKGRG